MSYVVSQAFLQRLADAFTVMAKSGTDSTNRIIVYQGTMPADADTYTEAGHSANELCRFTNFDVTNTTVPAARIYLSPNPTPSAVTATGTGTATWCALWSTALGEDRVILADVSENGGGGVLVIDSVNITSGGTVTFVNYEMYFLGA